MRIGYNFRLGFPNSSQHFIRLQLKSLAIGRFGIFRAIVVNSCVEINRRSGVTNYKFDQEGFYQKITLHLAGFRTGVRRVCQHAFLPTIHLTTIFIVHFTSSAMLGDSSKAVTINYCVTFWRLSTQNKISNRKQHERRKHERGDPFELWVKQELARGLGRLCTVPNQKPCLPSWYSAISSHC